MAIFCGHLGFPVIQSSNEWIIGFNGFLDLENLYLDTKIIIVWVIWKMLWLIIWNGVHLDRHVEFLKTLRGNRSQPCRFWKGTLWATEISQEKRLYNLLPGSLEKSNLAAELKLLVTNATVAGNPAGGGDRWSVMMYHSWGSVSHL